MQNSFDRMTKQFRGEPLSVIGGRRRYEIRFFTIWYEERHDHLRRNCCVGCGMLIGGDVDTPLGTLSEEDYHVLQHMENPKKFYPVTDLLTRVLALPSGEAHRVLGPHTEKSEKGRPSGAWYEHFKEYLRLREKHAERKYTLKQAIANNPKAMQPLVDVMSGKVWRSPLVGKVTEAEIEKEVARAGRFDLPELPEGVPF